MEIFIIKGFQTIVFILIVILYISMAWETWVQSQVESYQKLKKMVLDANLHYKVWIKGKVE